MKKGTASSSADGGQGMTARGQRWGKKTLCFKQNTFEDFSRKKWYQWWYLKDILRDVYKPGTQLCAVSVLCHSAFTTDQYPQPTDLKDKTNKETQTKQTNKIAAV